MLGSTLQGGCTDLGRHYGSKLTGPIAMRVAVGRGTVPSPTTNSYLRLGGTKGGPDVPMEVLGCSHPH